MKNTCSLQNKISIVAKKTILAIILVCSSVAAHSDDLSRMDLIRTTQLGAPYNTSVREIIEYSKSTKTNFLGHILAKSALLSVGHEELLDSWPVSKLLDRLLNQIVQNSPSYSRLEELPPGFNAEHAVFTMVYAMVVADQVDLATRVLAQHTKTESHFKKSVVSQALHMIGTRKANDLIQRIIEKESGDYFYLRDEIKGLLGFEHVPFLEDLRQHLKLIPPEKRGRENLVKIASRKQCDRQSVLAVYFLGFFHNQDDQDDIALLRELTKSGCGVIHRYFAVRSLALRSEETLDFWMGLINQELDAWLRAYLVRVVYVHFREAFLDKGLELLATEPAQHVQWELMWSNIQLRRRDVWRSYWDLWLTPTLQFRITHDQRKSRMYPKDTKDLLVWLQKGNYPRDSWVHTSMLRQIGMDVTGSQTTWLLDYLEEYEKEKSVFSAVQGLSDPRALDRVQKWADQENDPKRKAMLLSVVNRLKGIKEAEEEVPEEPCCDKTAVCLLATVRDLNEKRHDGNSALNPTQSEWLGSDYINRDDIRFIDKDGTHAEISFPNPPRVEHWKHAADCWILTKVTSE